MRIRLAISLLIAFCCCDLSALNAASAIRFGRLIDGQGKTWTNAVVLVRNGRVEKVLPSDVAIPADAKLIDVLAEMVKRGNFYVPTIDHDRYYVDAREEYKYDDKIVAGLNSYIEKNLETARRAHKAGVKFAMGSDAVFSMFGQNTRELGWFVKAGMTPAEALQTATSNAAALLRMSGQLGAIAPGYFADLVAVEGDPLSDIR
jgi:imidazolonepropionase-like amidohydrolase